MRGRIGIAIAEDAVFGVLVRSARVLRRERIAVTEGVSLENALVRILTALSTTRVLRPHVAVAIGGRLAQLRNLTRLPAVADSRALAALVRANPGRFFLQNASPLVIPAVRVRGPGDCDAAAFHEPTLQALVRACRLRHVRWDVAVPVRLLGGEGSDPFANAIAVARFPRATSLVVRPHDVRTLGREAITRWRLLAAGCVCLASLSAAVIAPVWVARRHAAAAEAALESLGDSVRVAQNLEQQLSTVSAELGTLDAFRERRRSMIALLADLTEVLPSDVSLTTLRMDDEGGTLTAIATRGGAVLSELQHSHLITDATVVGSVTAEGAGADRLERVSIRFRWMSQTRARRAVESQGPGAQ